MKRKLLMLLLVILCLSLTSCYQAPKNDISVYKTSAGAKYHRMNCRYVKGKAIDINLSRALYDGLEACKVCRPPTKKSLDDLNK